LGEEALREDCIYFSTILEKKKWVEKDYYQNIQINTCKKEVGRP